MKPTTYQPSTALIPQVQAKLSYLKSPSDNAFTYMYDPPDGNTQGNCIYEDRYLPVLDARSSIVAPAIDKEGFALWDAPTDMVDFWDEDSVRKTFYPEVENLACLATGASRAFVFDHMLRRRETGRPSLTFGRGGEGSQPGAAGRIHNDYSETSGRRKLPLVVRNQCEADQINRYSIVNIWRSINGPIQDTPLALCDAQTVSTLDMVACEVRRQDRVGEIYLARYSPRHKWFYYANMDCHEVLVFKQFDSKISGVSRITPHTAFDLPDIPAGAPLRESIEVRCLVVY